jgi:transcriptional regulator with XRE-family HTH domain
MDSAVDYFAETITKARRRRGLSRPELAELAGTTTPTISSWEEGRGKRQIETLETILGELGLELRAVKAR